MKRHGTSESNEQRYQRLIDTYNGVISSVCHSVFRYNEHYREELHSFLIVYLWDIRDMIPTGLTPKRLQAWMTIVMYRTAINWLHYENRRQQPLLYIDPEKLAESPVDEEEELRLRYLDMLIDQLPPRDQEMVLLYLQGYTFDEIAFALGRSKNAIRAQMFRIKQKLIQLKNTTKYPEL